MENENKKKVFEEPVIEVISIESESIMEASTIFGGTLFDIPDSSTKNWFGD